jgi:hypothetical protein
MSLLQSQLLMVIRGTMLRIKISLLLLLSFVVSFFLTTILTDYAARMSGFYAEGLADSECIESGDCE